MAPGQWLQPRSRPVTSWIHLTHDDDDEDEDDDGDDDDDDVDGDDAGDDYDDDIRFVSPWATDKAFTLCVVLVFAGTATPRWMTPPATSTTPSRRFFGVPSSCSHVQL